MTFNRANIDKWHEGGRWDSLSATEKIFAKTYYDGSRYFFDIIARNVIFVTGDDGGRVYASLIRDTDLGRWAFND